MTKKDDKRKYTIYESIIERIDASVDQALAFRARMVAKLPPDRAAKIRQRGQE